MPFIITRSVQGRPDEAPRRVGEYTTLSETARALANELKGYAEYRSDPDQQCWWTRDKLGRIYRFEAATEAALRA
jgi:hypothetical protein